jgi:hypothetical protein
LIDFDGRSPFDQSAFWKKVCQKMNERLPKFKGEKLFAEIDKFAAGLMYMSETDAPIETYSATVEFQKFITDTRHQEISAREFFARLTAADGRSGAREKEQARRFSELEKLLEENLNDLKVLKIGRIQIDIYVVGIDADGKAIGIKTKAVET